MKGYVYRIYQGGECLYVGSTWDLDGRLRRHRQTFGVGMPYTEVESEAVDAGSDRELLDAEIAAIIRHRPRCNGRGLWRNGNRRGFGRRAR